MKRLVLLAVILMAAMAVLSAAPVQCSAAVTLADLIADNALGGCISQDKIFSGFSYSTTGSITADLIGVKLVAILGTNDVHGWSFNPVSNQSWTAGFTLAYDISVAPGNGNLRIVGSQDQINTSHRPNNVVMTDTQTGNLEPIVPDPIMTSGLSNGAETNSSADYFNSIVHTVSTLTFGPTTGPGAQPVGALLSYEQDWFEGVGTPEPMTFVLIGSGLIGLAFVRRRFNKG